MNATLLTDAILFAQAAAAPEPTVAESLQGLLALAVIGLCIGIWWWWFAQQIRVKKSARRTVGNEVPTELATEAQSTPASVSNNPYSYDGNPAALTTANTENDWRLLQTPEPLAAPPGDLVLVMIIMSFISQFAALLIVRSFVDFEKIASNEADVTQNLYFTFAIAISQLFLLLIMLAAKQWYKGIRAYSIDQASQPKLPWVRILPNSRDWIIGIVGWLAIVPPILLLMVGLLQYDDKKHPLIEMMERMTKEQQSSELTWLIATIGLSVVVLAPLTEELLFRALILGWMRRGVLKIPFWPAVIINGVLFALAHFGHGYAPVALFFLAVGLGYIYEKTGRLWPCIMIHGLLNLMTFVVLVLQLKQS